MTGEAHRTRPRSKTGDFRGRAAAGIPAKGVETANAKFHWSGGGEKRDHAGFRNL